MNTCTLLTTTPFCSRNFCSFILGAWRITSLNFSIYCHRVKYIGQCNWRKSRALCSSITVQMLHVPFPTATGIGIHYLFTGSKCMECQVCISLLEQHVFHMNILKCHQNKILENTIAFEKYREWCFKTGFTELSWKKNKRVCDFHNASCFFQCLTVHKWCTFKETPGIVKYYITQ